jgi:hypothetical protein
MARQTFAGDLAAFTAATTTVSGQADVLIMARNVVGITAWTALTGGTQVTDLQDLGGSTITTVSSDANGLFAFKGPDEVYEVWLDTGLGSRQYASARLAAKVLASVPTSRQIIASTGLSGGGPLTGDVSLAVNADTTNQRVNVQDAGISIGTRKAVNFVDGTNFTFTVTDDTVNNRVNVAGSAVIPSGSGYTTIRDEGTALTARSAMNFIGAGVTAVDDAANARTNITITGATAVIPRPLHLLVASADAPALVKAGADYVCDGTADQSEINTALLRAVALSGAGIGGGTARGGPATGEQWGKVDLSGGRFIINGSILMQNATWLAGQGQLTEVMASGLSASTGVGTAPAMIKKSTQNDHLLHVSNFWLHGNAVSGGTTCHGIYFETTDGTSSYLAYPPSNPDSDHWIHDMFLTNFKGGTRHAVWERTNTTPAQERGVMIKTLQIRDVDGDAIRLETASDCMVEGCHIGSVAGYGVNANGGNSVINNVKAYFCDTAGFIFTSGRCSAIGCISQDSQIGFVFNGAPTLATGLIADTSLDAGIQVSTNQLVLSGFSIFTRTGGRYATGTRGLWFDLNTYTDLMVMGQIDDPNITSRIVGTPGARSFMRVSDGVSLVAFG